MKLDFSGIKILCIGDPMIDFYRTGHVDRVSPEAPVPIFVGDNDYERYGGAANVYTQLDALGCSPVFAWHPVVKTWTRKTRYMVGSHQLLRVDEDRCVPNIIPSLNGFHAIVISDYAKGACTPEICQEAIKSGLPVIVDPKGKDWTKYKGCRVICPNQHEVNGNEGFDVVEKLGALGLRYRGVLYPAVAQRVYDVTGAGDTVVAVISACVAKGLDIPLACKLANIAAGYVVAEVGTTVCPLEYLCKEAAYLCSSDSPTDASTSSTKDTSTSLQNAGGTVSILSSPLIQTPIAKE